jgi:hypothetical protein
MESPQTVFEAERAAVMKRALFLFEVCEGGLVLSIDYE